MSRRRALLQAAWHALAAGACAYGAALIWRELRGAGR